SKIFNLMGIDTHDVLEAAGTKWNFLPFKPGLVGGHCIGVDPYYLAQKAEELGYHPEIILAGRRMNDGMGDYVAKQVVKLMISNGLNIKDANVIVFGITFKENCPDVRNTKVVDVIRSLRDYGMRVTVFDPWADKDEVKHEYGLELVTELPDSKFDAIVQAVSHKEFAQIDLDKIAVENAVVFDVKGTLDRSVVQGRL
ncbi:MAG: nucleotide sugar dehydrogenase, partial [Bacteroidetes bacterium]